MIYLKDIEAAKPSGRHFDVERAWLKCRGLPYGPIYNTELMVLVEKLEAQAKQAEQDRDALKGKCEQDQRDCEHLNQLLRQAGLGQGEIDRSVADMEEAAKWKRTAGEMAKLVQKIIEKEVESNGYILSHRIYRQDPDWQAAQTVIEEVDRG